MKISIFVITIMLGLSLQAQTPKEVKAETIPAIVKSSFAKEFPKAKASWEADGTVYEAEFEINGVKTSASYDKEGHRTEVETEIKIADVPTAAIAYVTKHYPKQKITGAAKIIDDKNTIKYEVEIKKDGKPLDLLFDSKGGIIK